MSEGGRRLPDLVTVTLAFSRRLPSQRVLDQMAKLEGGVKFGELAEMQPARMIAFRALMREFPDYDPTALWLHSYDVEVDIEGELPANPTSSSAATQWPHSAVTGG